MLQDSVLNPLAMQDHVPLGITWVAHWLLELFATFIDPVLLDILVIPKHQLTTLLLVEKSNLLPALSPIGKLLLHDLDQKIHLVVLLSLRPGHGNPKKPVDCRVHQKL
jgi:hypothetical protein